MPSINEGFNIKYFNPLEKYDALKKIEFISTTKKYSIWLASIIVGALTLGVGGVALFRYLVMKNIKQIDPASHSESTGKTHTLSMEHFSSNSSELLSKTPRQRSSALGGNQLSNVLQESIEDAQPSDRQEFSSNQQKLPGLIEEEPILEGEPANETVLEKLQRANGIGLGGYDAPDYEESELAGPNPYNRFSNTLNAFDKRTAFKMEYRYLLVAFDKAVQEFKNEGKDADNLSILELRRKFSKKMAENNEIPIPYDIVGEIIFDNTFGEKPALNNVNENFFDQTFSLYYDGTYFSEDKKDFIYKAFKDSLSDLMEQYNTGSYKEVDPAELYYSYVSKIEGSPLFQEEVNQQVKTSTDGSRAVQVLAIALNFNGRGAGTRFKNTVDQLVPEKFKNSNETKLIKSLFFSTLDELEKEKNVKREVLPVSEVFDRYLSKIQGPTNSLSRPSKETAINAFKRNYSMAYETLAKASEFQNAIIQPSNSSQPSPPLQHTFKKFVNNDTARPSIYSSSAGSINEHFQIKTAAHYGGACTTACAISKHYQNTPYKIGLMVAANSGLPAGALSYKMGHVANSDLNVKTQEESVIADWLLTEGGTDSKKQSDLFNSTINGQWGMSSSIGTNTIQGIDFTTTRNAKDYNQVYMVSDATVSALRPGAAGKELDASHQTKVTFVFADSVNANPRIGSSNGTMQRTLNQRAINDYSFFKECVKEKLRASFDGMVSEGVQVALVAQLSVGIYAGQHQDTIKQDFNNLLQEVLDEKVGPNGEKRGSYFAEIIIPTLGTEILQ